MSLTDDQIVAKNFQKFYNGILPYLNGSAHSGFTPIGTVISVMGTTAPLNYLVCDGTVYNISDYSELAAYFNQQFGSSNFFGGNGTTTFAVPDLRGEFLRGTGTNSHANQGSGANVGVHQDGTEHIDFSVYPDSKQLSVDVNNTQYMISGNVDKRITTGKIGGSKSTLTYTAGGDDRMLYTSRPTNTSVLYCIASKNIFMDAGSNYSTEEQVVGTWVDGKPVYQKTLISTIPTAATAGTIVNKYIDVGASIDTYTSQEAWFVHSNGGIFSIPRYSLSTSGSTVKMVSISLSPLTNRESNNPNTVNVGNSIPNYNGFPVYITIQYTKTTD